MNITKITDEHVFARQRGFEDAEDGLPLGTVYRSPSVQAVYEDGYKNFLERSAVNGPLAA